MSNANLSNSKIAKNDEFYTSYNDIESELQHYLGAFQGKTIYCNCDNPEWSNFWRYFHLNFEHLGLKKLIATHYDKEKPTYKMEYTGGDDNNVEAGVITPLEGNGDFRNQECIDLLKEADIVVTNPPFSLFREYVNMLEEHNKKFLIIGNKNAITYKEFFPLLKDNKAWIGYSTPSEFDTPEGMTKKINGLCRWFTNLDIKKRHEKLILWKNYTPAEFPQYDNYDAINVDKVSNIPCDYCESWEVTEDEFKNFSTDEWEVTRTGERDGEKSLFIIPAANTKLRKLLHEHAAGYKEEIEKEMLKCLKKKLPKQVSEGSAWSSNHVLQLLQPRTIPDCRKRILTCSRQRPRIRSWKENVQQNLYPEDIVTEPLALQLHTLTVTTPPNLKSSAWTDTSKIIPNMDIDSQSGTKKNTQDLLSERYCNGVSGVPITFLDKYSPEQFEIVNANDYRKTESVPVKPHGLIKDKEGAVKKNCVCQDMHQKKALNCYRLEATAGISPENGNMQGFLSDRYCNGVFGVPITFFDKYSPEQFRIIWQASGNTKACCPENVLSSVNYRQHEEDRGGCGVVHGKRVYSRILVQKII